MRLVITSALAVLLTLAAAPPRAARADIVSRVAPELSLLVGYSDREDWVDALPGSQGNAVGFEHLARVSNERGEFLVTDLQLRLRFDAGAPADDAWSLEVHNAWMDYRLGLGRKLRLGHFAPAHGLEPVRDTHGTLAQTLAGLDIGFKKDWGLAYRGIAGPLDLTVALQSGAGMAPLPDDGSYAASAQVWTPPGRDSRFGLSILHGELRRARQMRTLPVPDYADGTVTTTRAGVAAERTAGAFLFMGEVSLGWNDGTAVGGAMLGAEYTPPLHQRLTFEAQMRAWDGQVGDPGAGVVTALAGVSWLLTDAVTLRTAVAVTAPDGATAETRAVAQLYYYGG